MLAVLATLLPTLAAPQTPAPVAPPHATNHLERIVILGASLSGGFGVERNFAEVIQASLRAPERPPLLLSSLRLFTDPHTFGAREISQALDARPSLVVAIDFLFWFGYGSVDARGGKIAQEAGRLELLEDGLALLSKLDCPLVVGDFPDMSAAVGKMMAPEQMPAKSTLPLLSRRVREWAATRKNTIVLPLSEIVPLLDSPEGVRMGRHVLPPEWQLLQDDQLHPTVEGLVGMAQLVCDGLVKNGLAREDDFDFDLASVMRKLKPSVTLPGSAGPRR